ncbi:MAG: carboxypeptidase regulatory-like domain-containing protein, partial [Candidatus Korobacteraceae bacterium]
MLTFVVFPSATAAQLMDGELRVTVRDSAGLATGANVELIGRSPEFHASAQTDAQGEARLARLPLGVHLLRVTRDGFRPFTRQVEIRSAVPQTVEASLQLAEVVTQITVEETAPVLDGSQPRLIIRAGRDQLAEAMGTTLGRSTIDVVTTMPGWLLEANAVLHPRGSEYDTQYVVDGMPVYDNRSLAFAPAFENSEFETVNVMTAGVPAEYGRRLGGVIALDSRRAGNPGFNFETNVQASSYDTYIASLSPQYRGDKTSFSAGIQGGHTQRYLDPPSLENFTNQANSGGGHLRLDRQLTDRDRLSFYLRSNRTGFQVPNDLEQQAAGQRQGRKANETAGQVHYQKTITSATLLSLRGMVRDLTAGLESNALSTPVYVDQDRGFREGVLIGDISHQTERHTLKFGGDVRLNAIRERFAVAEPDELPELDLEFSGNRRSTEAALYIQDHIRLGNFAASVGLRFDHYSLIIDDQAVSPRVALSYYFPKAGLQIRAAYDRMFQPPASENILFSSAAAGLDLDEVEDSIPVPPS